MFSVYSILSLAAAALAAQCPFPEIPKNGYAEMDGLRITFNDAEAVTFHAKDVVKYSCDSEWAIFSNNSQYIGCEEDGTWKGTVPKCCKFS
jgi:Sushi repeat (SCR repeat)